MIKTVGSAHYVHKSNINELITKYIKGVEKEKFLLFLSLVPKYNIQYDIVKYDKGNITLISSEDWDIANEPIVGTCYRWKKDNWFSTDKGLLQPKISKNYKQIYHNKWMFVANDYKGFDIECAKQRSLLWNSLPDIKQVKNKIGYKSFWIEYLSKYGLTL